jgi:hypothetical protein
MEKGEIEREKKERGIKLEEMEYQIIWENSCHVLRGRARSLERRGNRQWRGEGKLSNLNNLQKSEASD